MDSRLPSGSVKKAMWQTPVSNVSPWTSIPSSSSCFRAASTSETRSATYPVDGAAPASSRSEIVRLPVSNSGFDSGASGLRSIPSVSP